MISASSERYIDELQAILAKSRETRKRLIEILRSRNDIPDELRSELEKIDNQFLTLIYALDSTIGEMKTFRKYTKDLENKLRTISGDIEKAEKRDGRKIEEKFLKGHHQNIIEAIKRASIKKYGKPNFPVKPDEIVAQFRIIAPNAKVANETITRAVRRLAEYGVIMRVAKGLYKINE